MKKLNTLLSIVLLLGVYITKAQELPTYAINNHVASEEKNGLQNINPDVHTPNEHPLVSTRRDLWDGELEEWYHYDSTEITYVEPGLISQELVKRWYDGEVENYKRENNTYNSNDQLITHLDETWVDGAWGNANTDNRYIYLYENGNEVGCMRSTWYGDEWRMITNNTTSYHSISGLPDTRVYQLNRDNDDDLENYQRLSFEFYNGWDEVLVWYREEWDLALEEWILESRYLETYDFDGNRILQEQFLWQEGDWVPFRQEVYVYNDNGLNIEFREELWSAEEEEWNLQTRVTYQYNENEDVTTVETSVYDEELDEMKISKKDLYEYDGDHNLTAYTLLDSYFTGELINFLRREYTYYDDINERATMLEQSWSIPNNNWRNTRYTIYYYEGHNPTAIEDNATAARINLHLSPNPATDFIQISVEGLKVFDESLAVQLINVNGKVVKQASITSTTQQMAVGDIPAGTYWIRLMVDVQSLTHPIIIK